MYCNNCGNQINSESQFCNNCGAAIQNVNNVQPQTINQVSNNQQPIDNNPVNPAHQEFGNQNLMQNNQPNFNQNNKPNFDYKKYLPFIIGGVLVLVVMIFVISNLGGESNNNNNFNNNGNNNSGNDNNSNNNNNNNNQGDKLNRNYKVNSPASENSFKNLSFAEGEKYLRDIGFSDIEKDEFAYDVYDLDGYTAWNSVYKDEWLNDVVKIIFKNNQIYLSEVRLVYVEKDMSFETAYNDLSKLMSAFHGYKLDKAKLQLALTQAENDNDPDFFSKSGSEVYFIGDVGFYIIISISPETDYSPAKYTFEVRQSHR